MNCVIHNDKAAVGNCASCQAGLCGDCFNDGKMSNGGGLIVNLVY